jgi:hypothetical protein
VTRTIELTQGQVALVDDLDFDRINQWKWSANWDPKAQSFRAGRNITVSPGKQSTVFMSRFIMNAKPDEDVDHRNHDTLDNRRDNLRRCSNNQNMQNKRRYRNNTSGYKGVCWHVRIGKWQARVGFHGHKIHLGYFSLLEDAARAYNVGAQQAFGEYAYLNEV